MSWQVSASPLRFEEAVAHFAKRVPMTKRQWAKLSLAKRRQAFTIAGVAQLDLVTEVHAAIDRAIRDGLPFEDFRRDVASKLRRAWKGKGNEDAGLKTPEGRSARIELIFRNAVQQSYGAGRYVQARHPDTLKVRPFWQFDAINDSRTSEICAACDGATLPASDPWWGSHVPPLHHACRSGILTLTEGQAKRAGVLPKPPAVAAQEGFGLSPRADEWTPDSKGYPRSLWQQFTSAQRKAKAPPGGRSSR